MKTRRPSGREGSGGRRGGATRAPLLLVALAAAAVLRPGPGAAARPVREPLCVLAAGESLGNLEPCGCVEGMLGGFPRRLSVVRRTLREGDALVVDTGDQTGREVHPALLAAKTRHALELLREARAIVAVGERDLRLGTDALLRLGAEAGATLLLANGTVPGPGGPRRPFPAARRLAVSGRDVLVVGVLDPALGDPTGTLTLGDPAAAVRAAFAEHDPARTATRVVLFHGPEAAARAALGGEADLGADLVVCGHDQTLRRPLARLGSAALVEVVRDARALARVWLRPGEDARADFVPLDGRVPDDAWARARVDAYYAEVAGLPEPPRRPPPEGGQLQGSRACLDCHYAASQTHVGTRHHGAYARVVERDPARAGLAECVACHVTGAAYEGGFQGLEETPHLADVGCEACHGVGEAHLARGGGRDGYGRRPGFPESWRPVCVECHDPSNSPDFDFAPALERIRHWRAR